MDASAISETLKMKYKSPNSGAKANMSRKEFGTVGVSPTSQLRIPPKSIRMDNIA